MLWALLIALLIAKLSGGPEEIFLLPDFDKKIKKNVNKKDRQAEALEIYKQAKKEVKEFSKYKKKQIKLFEKLTTDQNVPSKEIQLKHKAFHESRRALQESLIDKRLLLQKLFTTEEWKAIIESAQFPSDKKQQKQGKQEDKQDKKISKILDEMEEVIQKNVKEVEAETAILESYTEFRSSIEKFAQESKEMNFQDNSIIRKKDATKDELTGFYEKQNEFRINGIAKYLKLRENVRSNTQEREWKNVLKSINQILKA